MKFGDTDNHYIAVENIQIIAHYADYIYKVTGPNDIFPDWIQSYLSMSRSALSEVEHRLEIMIRENRMPRRNPDFDDRFIETSDYMVHRNAFDILKYSEKIYNLIEYDQVLPDWMEHKIAISLDRMSEAAHYLMYCFDNQKIKKNPRKRRNPEKWYSVKITNSDQKTKKKKAVFKTKDGRRKKTTHFGAKGYSDYTIHKDEGRKSRYIARHKKNENWKDPTTAGALSRFILWNKKSVNASIKDFKKRFNLK